MLRPSASGLLERFARLPSENAILSSSLLARLRKFDEHETDQRYEELKKEVSDEINSFFRSQMLGKSTSDAAYSPGALDVYDAAVWGFNSPFLWRITQEDCQYLYDQYAKRVHCEIGVGTGIFLSELQGISSLTLMDANSNSLDACARRVQESNNSIEVSKVTVDITDTDSISEFKGQFRSVSANFLFHCLHGDNLLDKRDAFQNCASLMSPNNACFFGSTILGKDLLEDKSGAGEVAVQTMLDYNKWGIFGNKGDSFEGLEQILNETFDDVKVWRSGYCGVWKVENPKFT